MDCCDHAHTPSVDVDCGANLGRRHARRRRGTARFDRRRPDGRHRFRRARPAAKIRLRRCPHPWRDNRDHVEGASQRRSREWGSLAVACLADVPDAPILGRNTAGVLAALRTPEGLLYKYHLERLAWVDETVTNHGLRRALSAGDLEAAHGAGQPAIVGDVEGLDFLEGKLERLEEAHQRGVRHVQLVHYTPNDIGDFQTGTVTHQGLTSFGAEVIRACHRLGFVCDVAHATDRRDGRLDRDLALLPEPRQICRRPHLNAPLSSKYHQS
jgi:hypothetical protein